MEANTQELMREALNGFPADRVLAKTSEVSDGDKYTASVVIPWYLRPFEGVIRSMLWSAWSDGEWNSRKDERITVRRPHSYRGQR